MITAIDTNILLDILIGDQRFFTASSNALERAVQAGSR